VLKCPSARRLLLIAVNNPMHSTKKDRFDVNRLHASPRCTARSKRSGKRCQGPATAEPLAVALRPENKTAITGTEVDLPRQSLCFDG
jgi:hypothetical protein